MKLEFRNRPIPELQKLKEAKAFLALATDKPMSLKVEFNYLLSFGGECQLIQIEAVGPAIRPTVVRSESFCAERFKTILQSVIEMGGLRLETPSKRIIHSGVQQTCWIRNSDGGENSFHFIPLSSELSVVDVVAEIGFYFRGHDQETLKTCAPPGGHRKMMARINWEEELKKARRAKEN